MPLKTTTIRAETSIELTKRFNFLQRGQQQSSMKEAPTSLDNGGCTTLFFSANIAPGTMSQLGAMAVVGVRVSHLLTGALTESPSRRLRSRPGVSQCAWTPRRALESAWLALDV